MVDDMTRSLPPNHPRPQMRSVDGAAGNGGVEFEPTALVNWADAIRPTRTGVGVRAQLQEVRG